MENKNALIINGDHQEPVDEQTKKRVHQHLTNKDDVISEQDIANVKTEIIIVSDNNDEIEKAENIANNNGAERIKDNSDTDIDTTWNVLKE